VNTKFSSWHVGVSAEAIVAGLFARHGYDVSVQYGANQPEYDLIVSQADKLLRVSVKGTQEIGWGLCQNYLSNENDTYHAAIDAWLKRHNSRTVLCLVSFHGVQPLDMPRVYIAPPQEVA
jgi:Holliday junction resolvase-like predicted endonuclease